MTYGFYHTTSYSQVLVNVMPDQLFHSIWYDGGWNGLVLPVWVNGLLATLGLLALLAGVWALLHKARSEACRLWGFWAASWVRWSRVSRLPNRLRTLKDESPTWASAFALIATMGAMCPLDASVDRGWACGSGPFSFWVSTPTCSFTSPFP